MVGEITDEDKEEIDETGILPLKSFFNKKMISSGDTYLFLIVQILGQFNVKQHYIQMIIQLTP